jgi:Ran GTPase-activating protein (RanGAP) involved in mRNA processing and transport
MSLDPIQELRALLASPGYASWCALCQRFLAKDLLPQVSQEVTARLNAWSDDLRALPASWMAQPFLANNAAPLIRAAHIDFVLWAELPLPELLNAFSDLRQLTLRAPSLAHCASLSSLPLTHLNISNTSLASLSQVSLAASLLHLDLANNQLTEAEFTALPKSLHRLDLSHNQLCSLTLSAAPMLRELSLENNPLSPEALEALWRSEALPMLRELDLGHIAHAAEPLYFQAKPSPICRQVQRLSLNKCNVTDEQIESIVRRSDSFSQLQELHLQQNPISEDGLSTLGKSLVGKRLRALSLSANPDIVGFDLYLFSMLRELSIHQEPKSPAQLSAECLRELPWGKLESLSLQDLSLGDEVIEVLAEAPLQLTSLDLGGNQLSQMGVRRLLIQCDLGSVKRLSFAGNILQSAVAFLAEYESAYRVEHLDLSETALDEVGFSALCDWLSALVDEGLGLRSLRLSDNAMSQAMLDALAQCRGASRITELHLDGCDIHDDGLSTLLRSAHLTQLRSLDLQKNPALQSLSSLFQNDTDVRLSRMTLSDTPENRAICQEHLRHLSRPLVISLVKDTSDASTAGSSP